MPNPISFMCRRARLIRGETQGEFAIHMGVDQATVSRWERTIGEPTSSNLAEIRGIMTAAEPCHSRAYIEAAPTYKWVGRMDDFSVRVMISKGLAEWIGCTYEEMMAAPRTRYWTKHDQRVNDLVQADPRWLRGEIAFLETCHLSSHPGQWWHTIGAPIADTNTVLWEGIPSDKPNQKFWVKLTPFEHADDAA